MIDFVAKAVGHDKFITIRSAIVLFFPSLEELKSPVNDRDHTKAMAYSSLRSQRKCFPLFMDHAPSSVSKFRCETIIILVVEQ